MMVHWWVAGSLWPYLWGGGCDWKFQNRQSGHYWLHIALTSIHDGCWFTTALSVRRGMWLKVSKQAEYAIGFILYLLVFMMGAGSLRPYLWGGECDWDFHNRQSGHYWLHIVLTSIHDLHNGHIMDFEQWLGHINSGRSETTLSILPRKRDWKRAEKGHWKPWFV
jgi:hypothetical protein